MALKKPLRVVETSTTEGTDDFELDGAVDGYVTFDANPDIDGCVDGDTVSYHAEDVDPDSGVPLGDFEVGLGTWRTGGIIERPATVIKNSNGDTSPVSFAAGTRRIVATVLPSTGGSGLPTLAWAGGAEELDSAQAYNFELVTLSSTKAMAVYFGPSATLCAKIIDESGGDLTPGSELDTLIVLNGYLKAVALDSTTVFVAYDAETTGYITGVVLTVSGSTITDHSPETLGGAASYGLHPVFLSSTEVAIAYQSGTSTANIVVASVSGSTITGQTPLTNITSGDGPDLWSFAVLSATDVVFTYFDGSDVFASITDVSTDPPTLGAVTNPFYNATTGVWMVSAAPSSSELVTLVFDNESRFSLIRFAVVAGELVMAGEPETRLNGELYGNYQFRPLLQFGDAWVFPLYSTFPRLHAVLDGADFMQSVLAPGLDGTYANLCRLSSTKGLMIWSDSYTPYATHVRAFEVTP